MDTSNTIYVVKRQDWRNWLAENFKTEREIWLVYPKKYSGKPRIPYNDAVEEALCFGWIDSTIKSLDNDHSMQRFTPRNPKSGYSQPNKERLKWLMANQMIHPDIVPIVVKIISDKFVYPADIMEAVNSDYEAARNFHKLSDSYKRIRIAYIESARNRPHEFEKRLANFIEKTKKNKLIPGYGGIEKYY